MIRFQDTVEKKDTSELLSSATFQDIRPTGSMSTEDAVLFLDGLFSIDPESQDMYSIDEESLLAEIFGRFEDEFDFDFELDDEIQTVLDRFGAAKWENLSDGEKTDAINELASVIAKKLGIYEEPRIHFCDGQNGAVLLLCIGGVNLAVNFEEDVHGAHFFHVFALLAVQPQHLTVALLLGLLAG